jgi:hypothetical protein
MNNSLKANLLSITLRRLLCELLIRRPKGYVFQRFSGSSGNKAAWVQIQLPSLIV